MSTQLTGNVGLYLVCAELSKLGYNVMPTARNAKGVDIVGYDESGRSFTVQVKALTKRNSVPLGSRFGPLPADYYVIVMHAHEDQPIYHVLTRRELQTANIVQSRTKANGAAFWFEPKEWYGKDCYVKDCWKKIRPT